MDGERRSGPPLDQLRRCVGGGAIHAAFDLLFVLYNYRWWVFVTVQVESVLEVRRACWVFNVVDVVLVSFPKKSYFAPFEP